MKNAVQSRRVGIFGRQVLACPISWLLLVPTFGDLLDVYLAPKYDRLLILAACSACTAFTNGTAAITAAGISVWVVSHSVLDYSIHIYCTVTRYGGHITVV